VIGAGFWGLEAAEKRFRVVILIPRGGRRISPCGFPKKYEVLRRPSADGLLRTTAPTSFSAASQALGLEIVNGEW
jgi:hypothetical protein